MQALLTAVERIIVHLDRVESPSKFCLNVVVSGITMDTMDESSRSNLYDTTWNLANEAMHHYGRSTKSVWERGSVK
jgi:hypothetical protein